MTTSATDPILYDVEDGVATVTLNRPHRRNALTLDAMIALGDALRRAQGEPEIRVVLITGAGGDFCAGADLSCENDPMHPLESMRLVNDTVEALHRLTKPVIAQVDGVAVGAGWNLALLCDFVVASPRARFSQIFTRRGLSIDFGGSWILPRLVGLHTAKRLTLTAEIISAQEAFGLGLVTWIREDDELGDFVTALARRLAAGPPVAMALTKSLIEQGATSSLTQALADEARAQSINFATVDTDEGFAAFAERRNPEFTGLWFRHAENEPDNRRPEK